MVNGDNSGGWPISDDYGTIDGIGDAGDDSGVLPVSRRSVLRLAAAVGATSSISGISSAFVADTTPDLTKWAQSLPRPSVAQPDGTQDGYDLYQLPIQESTHTFHPDLGQTTIWGFEGEYPGPVIEAQRGTPIRLSFDNSALPSSHLFTVDTSIGGTQAADYDDYSGSVPEVRTSTHLHGGRVEPASDGQATDWTSPGGVQGPGFQKSVHDIPNAQPRMTSTYHDHTLGITRYNAYAGMVGLYALESQAEQNLSLPSGDYDVPLLLQDKAFNSDGSLFYPGDFKPSFAGDTAVVNGAVWPTLDVEPRRYRFRVVNGSNHRTFSLGLQNEGGSGSPPLYQFAAGHGFLESVVEVGEGGALDRLVLTPFERAEIIVDFSGYAGETFTLANAAEFPYLGDDSGSDLPELLRINVGSGSTSDPTTHPTNLSLPSAVDYDETTVRQERTFSLDTDTSGELLTHKLNGYGFGEEPGVVEPAQGTNEIWEFVNETPHAHPIHLHLVDFRVIGRGPNGYQEPDPNELGGKDTVRVEPGETVRILTRFKEFSGRYPWHCHALEHEDNKMMQQFDVQSQKTLDVLVCSLTEWFYHSSIDEGNQAIQNMASDLQTRTNSDAVNVDVITSNETGWSEFPSTATELQQYDVLVFNNSQGQGLTADQKSALQQFVRNGNGVAAIHNAADSHKNWDWYGDMIGAVFTSHPSDQNQEAELYVEDQNHPSTDHLPARYLHNDEFYDWEANPRGDVHVLINANQDSYSGWTGSREDHPLAWCHEFETARVWYTNLGHLEETWSEQPFLEHVKEGIIWAAGLSDGEASGTVWDTYSRTELTGDVSEPMSMTVAPDGRVFVINRDADINVVDPDTGETKTALAKEFYTSTEDGGHSVAVDPDFAQNGYLYAYYSPKSSEFSSGEDTPYNLLVRYTVSGDTIDPNSKTEILKVHTQRTNPNHYGGEIQFGPDGDLWLSTGDNTSPFDSSGYTPIDESTSEEGRDAQGTAADTSDLRGKLLRISPNADGSYDVPSGNLQDQSWASGYDDATVRPEIYAMGLRNPFRFHVDDANKDVYLADFGPDAGSWDANRGPPGIVEYNKITGPSYLGWPYVVGPNHPYIDYDFGTGTSGSAFDPQNLTNDSPNNGGLQNLPAPSEAMMYVHGSWDTYLNPPSDGPWTVPNQAPFPELGDEAPIAGPLVRLPSDAHHFALPDYLEGKWLIAEWSSGTLHVVSLDDNGDLLSISPFLPDVEFHSPMDLEVGPGGRLHYIDFGPGYYVDNPKVYRIDQGSRLSATRSGGTDTDATAPFGLNCAGNAVTVDDVDYVGGAGASSDVSVVNDVQSASTGDGIANTSDDALYQSAATGTDIGYDVDVAPGYYDVTLHFAEIEHNSTNQRVFDVSVQGSTVATDLDVYAAAGHDAAHTVTVQDVEVLDGLRIRTASSTGASLLSAITVRNATPHAFEDGIALEGTIEGWEGVAPTAVQARTNPTLFLEPGRTYDLEWTNGDGANHNFNVIDANDNSLVSTQLMGTQGQTQTVQFTASAAMSEYYCEPHSSSMRGQVVPSPYFEVDATPAGDATFDHNALTLDAAGTDVWSSADEYAALVEGGVDGDVTAEVTVASQENTEANAQAGLLVRNDATLAGSSLGYVTLHRSPDDQVHLSVDSNDDGHVDTSQTVSVSAYPTTLRLSKSGTTFTGEVSTDGGSTWTTVGSVDAASANTTQDWGVYACSHVSNTKGTVEFDNFAVTSTPGDATAPTTPSNLSSPSQTQTSIDLDWDASTDSGGSGLDHYDVYVDGSKVHQVAAGTTSTVVSGLTSGTSFDCHVTAVDEAGNESAASNTVTVTPGTSTSQYTAVDTTAAGDATFDQANLTIDAAGADVWSSADEYGALVAEDVDGDVTATTTVTSQENTNGWAKAGLMLANDASAGGSSAGDLVVAVTPSNGFTMQWDADGDGYVDTSTTTGSTAYPAGLRVTKSGTTFTGEYSTDGGSTWTQIDSVDVSAANATQDVALFVTSHSAGTKCTADFDGFTREAPTTGITDGTYRIDAVHSGKPMEAADTTEGATVQQNSWSGAATQQWVVQSNGDGTYTVENAASGYVLDVDGGSTSDGANVLVWSSNGNDNQRFTIAEDGSGYRIEAVHSGKVVEVDGGSTSDGANVHQWTDSGGDNQRWTFTSQ